MVPKIRPAGRSFVGLGKYLLHDVKQNSAERVGWTHSLNCANDDPQAVIEEMLWTYRDAEALRQEAEISGRGTTKPVKHISLSWAPDEEPSREQMLAAAESFLANLGASDHQALIVSHDDKVFKHLHIALCRVHPETGALLDDGFEKRRASSWALNYEREQGRIYCEQRLDPVETREPSPTRDNWLAFQKEEKAFGREEAARQNYDPDFLKSAENQQIIAAEEWTVLKKHQREQREAFIEGGRDQFNAVRKDVYSEVREEFRERWADYYAVKREGGDADVLAEMRADILAEQKEVLTARRDEAYAALRAERDDAYRELLDTQKEWRGELTERQADGLTSPYLLDLAYGAAAAREENGEAAGNRADCDSDDVVSRFSETATEIMAESERDTLWHERVDEADEVSAPPTHTPGVRSGVDAGERLTFGVIGGASRLVENLFDGYFGASPTPKKAEPPRPRGERPEFPAHNPFAAAAEEARLRAERQREATERDWWDERRARARD